MTKTTISHKIVTLLWLLNSSVSFAGTQEVLVSSIKPVQEIIYRNKIYHFSFALPIGWEKQSGNVNADSVLFMQLPLTNSCSFQINITPMPASFSAEVAATTFLAAAYHERRLNKLAQAKRRDTWIKEKAKDKSKDKDKIVLLTRGWEITEKSQKQKLQRIIYQVYDHENHYFNFVAAATSEKFSSCTPELRKIMDSISFLPL